MTDEDEGRVQLRYFIHSLCFLLTAPAPTPAPTTYCGHLIRRTSASERWAEVVNSGIRKEFQSKLCIDPDPPPSLQENSVRNLRDKMRRFVSPCSSR